MLASFRVPGTVLLWGWIRRDDFLARCETVNYGYGPRYYGRAYPGPYAYYGGPYYRRPYGYNW